jgi:hypothetical protein
MTAWMLPPCAWALPEYHTSMSTPRTLTVFSRHRSAGMIFPFRITWGKALVPGPFQRLAQIRGLGGEHRDNLLQVPVGGGSRDAMVTGQRIRGGAVAEPPQPQHRLPETRQRPAALGVPRRRHSASSIWAANQASSLRTSTVAR